VPQGRRAKREPHRPSAEFGKGVVALLAELGKSREDLLRATKYSGTSTIERLTRGEGSMLFAIHAKRALKEWGADVGKLPPLDDAEDGGEPLEEWQREWRELGERLHQLASDKRFQVEVDRIREVIRAHELVAEGTRG
jgi:hypothetical protein